LIDLAMGGGASAESQEVVIHGHEFRIVSAHITACNHAGASTPCLGGSVPGHGKEAWLGQWCAGAMISVALGLSLLHARWTSPFEA
jgi:hypothetical protein